MNERWIERRNEREKKCKMNERANEAKEGLMDG